MNINPSEEKPNEAVKKVEKGSQSKEKTSNVQADAVAEQKNQSTSIEKQAQSLGNVTGLQATANIDVTKVDVGQIIQWMQEMNREPKELKKLLETLDERIDLVESLIVEQNSKLKRIPSVDKRIETIPSPTENLALGERQLTELAITKLRTEQTNLREKRLQVRDNFKKVCGSEQKALDYQHLLAKSKSQEYHRRGSYFIRGKMLKIFNVIINSDSKSDLIAAKTLAENSTEGGLKEFASAIRELLYDFDEDLVVLCSHKHRDYYFEIMRLTILKWSPDIDSEIVELVIPEEEKQ